MYVAETKAQISCMVTKKLICTLLSHMKKAGFLMMQLKYQPNLLLPMREKVPSDKILTFGETS